MGIRLFEGVEIREAGRRRAGLEMGHARGDTVERRQKTEG